MVNTRTDVDLSTAVQNALQTFLPQIRAEISEEFRTSSGPLDAGGNPPPVTIHTWQKSGDRHQPTSQQSSHRNHGHSNDRHGQTGIPVMGVTRETGVSSPTDLPFLVPNSPGVPLRATPTQFALRVDADTQESVVELLVLASSVV
nr:hypothetical protein [Tanacetum cinerariifolium]